MRHLNDNILYHKFLLSLEKWRVQVLPDFCARLEANPQQVQRIGIDLSGHGKINRPCEPSVALRHHAQYH